MVAFKSTLARKEGKERDPCSRFWDTEKKAAIFMVNDLLFFTAILIVDLVILRHHHLLTSMELILEEPPWVTLQETCQFWDSLFPIRCHNKDIHT